jgi:hypothetical protein
LTFVDSALVPENVGEVTSSASDSRSDGANGDSQDLGDFVVVEVGDIAKNHGDAEVFGEECERLVENVAFVDRGEHSTAAEVDDR